ncbi:MAG TPA: hypothetical protein VES42_26025 [Pilimelia sp.]|nr:hypothetical protein [Pilimelia sp.]
MSRPTHRHPGEATPRHRTAAGRHEGSARARHRPTDLVSQARDLWRDAIAPRPAVPFAPPPAITTAAALRRRLLEFRLNALALGVAAFGLRIVVELWLSPFAWRLPAAYGVAFLLVATMIAAAGPLALFAAHVRRHRRLPRTFLLATGTGGPAFAVPTSPWLAAAVVAYLVLAAGMVPLDRTATGLALAADAGGTAVLLVLPLAGLAAWALRRGPRVLLTPAGLLVRPLSPGRPAETVTWDDLAAAHVPVPGRRCRELVLRTGRPATPPLHVPLTWLWVSPVFLAAAIRHYAQDAAHRAGIGTPAELHRLTRALTGANRGW